MFTPDMEGLYSIALEVSDCGLTGSDTMSIYAFTTQTFASADIPSSIPDNDISNGVAATVSVSGGPASLSYLRVSLDITHTYDADLDIWLESPSGTLVELSTDNGSSGDNYASTEFSGIAAIAITDAAAPFTGLFLPEGSLSDFFGEAADGTWTLHVYDAAAGDLGTLNSWSLSMK